MMDHTQNCNIETVILKWEEVRNMMALTSKNVKINIIVQKQPKSIAYYLPFFNFFFLNMFIYC